MYDYREKRHSTYDMEGLSDLILAMDFWRSQASADDPRNTVLTMPPSLCLDQRRDKNVCKKNGDDLNTETMK